MKRWLLILPLFFACALTAHGQVCTSTVVGSGITCVNEKTHHPAGTVSSTTVIYTTGYPANSKIVVGVLGTVAWTAGMVSNTAGYTWSFWGDCSGVSGTRHLGIYYASVSGANPSSDTITATSGSSTIVVLNSAVYTGVGAIDGVGVCNSGTGTSITTGNYTVTNFDLNIGLAYGDVLAPGNAWQSRSQDIDSLVMMEDQLAISTTAAATFTPSASSGWVTAGVAFLPTAAGGPVITPPGTPLIGAIGSNFTIAGTGFGGSQGGSSVTVNGVSASVSSWGATSITAAIPAAGISGPLTVNVSSVPSASVPIIVTFTPAILPQLTVDTTMPTQGGTVRNVTAGSAASLQAALNAATCGDTIVVPANNTYSSSSGFTVPNQGACSGWILVESSAIGSLPAGTRISGACSPATTCPAPSTTNLATLISTSSNAAVITVANGAHNWRFMGLEMTFTPGLSEFFLFNTDNGQYDISQLPSNIIVDRCYIHGDTSNGSSTVQNGLDFQVIGGAMIDSDLRTVVDIGTDSTAIWIYNSPGPYLFRNNFVSGASEDSLIGGQPIIANIVPSDITVIGNHFWKPLSWMGNGLDYTVKNGWELKSAQRVLADGNVIEYDWVDGQQGAIVLLTVRGGEHNNGCSLCTVQDVTFTHNIVQHSFSGVNWSASDNNELSLPDSRILMQNNLFTDLNSSTYGSGTNYAIQYQTIPVNWLNGGGILQQPANNMYFDHNTVAISAVSDLLYFANGSGGNNGDTMQSVQITNNMMDYGSFGLIGDSTASGSAALTLYASAGPIYNINTWLRAAGNPGSYPAGSFWSTDSTAGFTNYSGGNYQLLNTSPYYQAGTDSKDVGVWDWTCLNNETNAALAGTFTQATFCGPGSSSFAGFSRGRLP